MPKPYKLARNGRDLPRKFSAPAEVLRYIAEKVEQGAPGDRYTAYDPAGFPFLDFKMRNKAKGAA